MSIKKKNFLVLLAAAALILVGYIVITSWNASRPSARETIVALSEQGKSGESGTATIKESGDKVLVTLSLVGAPKGVTQPAHIHKGQCPGVGEVVYPLVFPVDGVSETTLNVSYDKLMSQVPLAVNVHKSTTQASVYVACGGL